AVVLAITLFAPIVVEAQQAGKLYRIGVLGAGTPLADMAGPEPRNPTMRAFLQELSKLGYIEGQNVVIERRSAEGMLDRLPAIAAELARRHMDVIVAGGPTLAGLKEARLAIPVVMTGSPDPVTAGLVTILAHPGGNFTGMSLQHSDLDRKRLELLTQIVPGASRIAVLRGPDADSEGNWKQTQAAARLMNREVRVLEVRRPSEIESAFLMPEAFVFGGDKPQAGWRINEKWRSILQSAKVRYRHPEMLRHTWASTLLSRNAPLLYVQKGGGWKSAGVLLRVYSRWIEQALPASPEPPAFLTDAR